jgi:hypothetical protein
MPRLPLALAIAAALAANPAAATPVSFAGAADAAGGATVDTTIRVRLVDANDNRVGALRTADGRPVATDQTFSYDAASDTWTDAAGADLGADPLVVDLAAQDVIARPGAAPTYYSVAITQGAHVERYSVQVADGSASVSFFDLVSGAAVPAADIAAGRLVPAGGAAGRLLAKASAADYDVAWITAAGTGDMLAAVYDPQGLAGDAFALAAHTGSLPVAQISGLEAEVKGYAGTAALDLVQLDASGRLPAVDGSQLLNLPGGSGGAGACAELTGATAAGCALVEAADAAAQRTALGLGAAAQLAVGTTAGTVAAGDDARITGAVQSVSAGLNVQVSGTAADPIVSAVCPGTDLGVTYSTTTVGISSSNGGDVTLAAASAGVSAGVLSAAQAQRLADCALGSDLAAYLLEADLDSLAELNAQIGATLDTTSDPRTPSAHAASHAAGGADALTLTLAQISDAGTAAALDTGTAEGDVPVLAAGGALPAVPGIALTSAPLGAATADSADVASGTITLDAATCRPGVLLYRRLTGDSVTVSSDATATYRCELLLGTDSSARTAGWAITGQSGAYADTPGLWASGYHPALLVPVGTVWRLVVEVAAVGGPVLITPAQYALPSGS